MQRKRVERDNRVVREIKRLLVEGVVAWGDVRVYKSKRAKQV